MNAVNSEIITPPQSNTHEPLMNLTYFQLHGQALI